MSPRGKAKAKKNTEENGSEKRVRESRNVKAASYKDFSDSEDDKPVRRRKKDSDSEVSLSEEEKPKKVVAKGRGRAAPRSKKQESESDEASEFNSDESSGGDSRKKKKKPARKPVRSLRTPQRASYKDLSDSEDESNNEEEEDDDEELSEKEDKRAGDKRKRGSPPKRVGKKSKKNESSGSEDEELDEEDEEEVEDEEENEEGDEEGKGKADKPTSKKKAVDETAGESGNKSKGESEKKVEKPPRPEHELSEEEDGDEEKEKEQPVKADSKEVKDAGNDTKKRGRPSKKAANSKVEEDDDDNDDAEEEEPLPKKAKAGEKVLLNKTESNYASIDFSSEAKTKDGKPWNFKISSWNVAGLKSWVKKNGIEYIKREDPDIICLQETKCSEKKLPPESKVEGYHAYWHSGDKEGYAGVAILSKTKPVDVKFGIEKTDLDNEGRVITAEYEKFYLVNVYVPNAGQGLKSLPRRLEWDPAFRAYLKSLDEKKPVILCGDLNVAHNEIDLANPKTNTKSAGFTPQEREGMTELLKQGFVDTFRSLYPDKTGAYSFWTYMSNARSRNVGWRLDYFITSERFVPQICDNVIRNEVFGSDHCPITLFANV